MAYFFWGLQVRDRREGGKGAEPMVEEKGFDPSRVSEDTALGASLEAVARAAARR